MAPQVGGLFIPLEQIQVEPDNLVPAGQLVFVVTGGVTFVVRGKVQVGGLVLPLAQIQLVLVEDNTVKPPQVGGVVGVLIAQLAAVEPLRQTH